MLILILNVFYVLIAIAMVVLILLQRGAGAQAGSGFGAGASGTVFGARGSASFLSKSTKWLAISFFTITLLMAWLHVRAPKEAATGAAGSVMADAPATPAKKPPTADVPQAPASTVPAVPQAPATQAPAQNNAAADAKDATAPSQKP